MFCLKFFKCQDSFWYQNCLNYYLTSGCLKTSFVDMILFKKRHFLELKSPLTVFSLFFKSKDKQNYSFISVCILEFCCYVFGSFCSAKLFHVQNCASKKYSECFNLENFWNSVILWPFSENFTSFYCKVREMMNEKLHLEK